MLLPIADAALVRHEAATLLRRHRRGLAAVVGLHALAALAGPAGPNQFGRLIDRVTAGTAELPLRTSERQPAARSPRRGCSRPAGRNEVFGHGMTTATEREESFEQGARVALDALVGLG